MSGCEFEHILVSPVGQIYNDQSYCFATLILTLFITKTRAFSRISEMSLLFEGSATELRYALHTFGILTKGLIPAEGEQDAKPELIHRYLQTRRDVEKRREETSAAEEISKTGIIPFPNRHDVLLGRGRPYPESSGNRRLLELVDGEMERYKECKHWFEKSRVIADVIATVRKSGGFFF
jgi:hypothetical protein